MILENLHVFSANDSSYCFQLIDVYTLCVLGPCCHIACNRELFCDCIGRQKLVLLWSFLWGMPSPGQSSNACICAIHFMSQYISLNLWVSMGIFVKEYKNWAWDLIKIELSVQVTESTMQDGYTSAAFHPDGLILGMGTAESLVRIWDVKSQVCLPGQCEYFHSIWRAFFSKDIQN